MKFYLTLARAVQLLRVVWKSDIFLGRGRHRKIDATDRIVTRTRLKIKQELIFFLIEHPKQCTLLKMQTVFIGRNDRTGYQGRK